MTRFVIVATKARDRWFDVDAVRTEYKGNHKYGKGEAIGGRGADYDEGVRSSWSNRPDVFREDRGGAPPLDWMIVGDDPPDSYERATMGMARFLVGDVFAGLATLNDDSVDLVFSSPPFLALRSYLPADHPDKANEIGSEQTPADYLDALLDVVEACSRVLAPHGSLCFELGDTYSGPQPPWGYTEEHRQYDRQGAGGMIGGSRKSSAVANEVMGEQNIRGRTGNGWPLAKSLTGIPTLFAWSLAYGRNLLRPERTIEPWRVRNLVPWCRPNPPVGALGDKWRPATSYVTVATKARDRWFDLDAVRVPLADSPGNRYVRKVSSGDQEGREQATDGIDRETNKITKDYDPSASNGAPPLDFMVLPTAPYRGAHYATFPPGLVTPFVRSMCPSAVCRVCGEPRRRILGEPTYESTVGGRVVNHFEGEQRAEGARAWSVEGGNPGHVVKVNETLGWTDCGCSVKWELKDDSNFRPGVVLDPFAGSGTTLMVATGEGRDAIGIDLDPRNADLAVERCGMFLTVESAPVEQSA